MCIRDRLTASGASVPAMYGAAIIGDGTDGLLIFGQSGSTQQGKVFRYVVNNSAVVLTDVTLTGAVPTARSFVTVKGSVSSGIIYSGRAGSTEYNEFYSYTAS